MDYLPQLSARIKGNQKTFLRLVGDIKKEPNLRRRCLAAARAATFATGHNTDIFASAEIEQPFLELAELLPACTCDDYEEGSVLHVATEVYNSGGHTRCIERWIQLMDTQKHSCFLINQNAPIPKLLTQVVQESGGELHTAEPGSMVGKAKVLREYASRFQYIVLHIHMDDPVALIAFGSRKFKRPIILFNHADHIFWLGAGIADYVADLAEDRHKITQTERNIPRSEILGIPVENKPFVVCNQQEARQIIGIPQEAKVIFASGHARKFDAVGTPDFADIMVAISRAVPGTRFYLVGPNPKQDIWKKIPQNIKTNIIFTGRLDYNTEYPLYLSAADMVLDSFPVNGGTAVIDAVKAGKPILTLKRCFIPDFLNQSQAGCETLEQMTHKASCILNDIEYRKQIYHDVYSHWVMETDVELWKQRCHHIYAALPTRHNIYPLAPPTPPSEISEISLITGRWTEPEPNKWKAFRRWVYSRRKNEGYVQLFGHRFYSADSTQKIYRDGELNEQS